MPAPKRTNNKKKQSFLSRLVPTTRKSKALTLIAAFAIIGGGFMVYRSFAAVGQVWTYTPANGSFTAFHPNAFINTTGGCASSVNNDIVGSGSSKSSVRVLT